MFVNCGVEYFLDYLQISVGVDLFQKYQIEWRLIAQIGDWLIVF